MAPTKPDNDGERSARLEHLMEEYRVKTEVVQELVSTAKASMKRGTTQAKARLRDVQKSRKKV